MKNLTKEKAQVHDLLTTNQAIAYNLQCCYNGATVY